MNKTEFVNAIAEKEGLEKKKAEQAVNAVLEGIQDALAKGEKLQFVGFGTFEVRERPAKQGRNPKTGETINIPASKAPAFKAGKAFKDIVAK